MPHWSAESGKWRELEQQLRRNLKLMFEACSHENINDSVQQRGTSSADSSSDSHQWTLPAHLWLKQIFKRVNI